MEELIQQLKVAMADTVAFSMKARQYHWNVEGDDFPQFHQFFGNLYEETAGAVDTLGELIRTLDAYAPMSPTRIAELTSIVDTEIAPRYMVMVRYLYNDNNTVINSLMETYRLCERYSEFGVCNFIQDRIQAHKAHLYMLRSTLKEEEK
jgi:starvation-inducible DNA-binding protein